MADDREPYEPLWAEGLRRRPAPEPEAPAQPKTPSSPAGPALAIAALVAFGVLFGVVVAGLILLQAAFAHFAFSTELARLQQMQATGNW